MKWFYLLLHTVLSHVKLEFIDKIHCKFNDVKNCWLDFEFRVSFGKIDFCAFQCSGLAIVDGC